MSDENLNPQTPLSEAEEPIEQGAEPIDVPETPVVDPEDMEEDTYQSRTLRVRINNGELIDPPSKRKKEKKVKAAKQEEPATEPEEPKTEEVSASQAIVEEPAPIELETTEEEMTEAPEEAVEPSAPAKKKNWILPVLAIIGVVAIAAIALFAMQHLSGGAAVEGVPAAEYNAAQQNMQTALSDSWRTQLAEQIVADPTAAQESITALYSDLTDPFLSANTDHAAIYTVALDAIFSENLDGVYCLVIAEMLNGQPDENGTTPEEYHTVAEYLFEHAESAYKSLQKCSDVDAITQWIADEGYYSEEE